MPLAAKLAGHHPVHVIDLSGFGLSCNPGRVLNVAEYADHLADWLEQGLAAVPAARRLDIRYEALVAEPLATMRQLAAFAGLADRRDWVQELARLRTRTGTSTRTRSSTPRCVAASRPSRATISAGSATSADRTRLLRRPEPSCAPACDLSAERESSAPCSAGHRFSVGWPLVLP